MTHKEVEDYLMQLPDVKLDYPFGERTAVYKVFVPTASTSDLDVVQGSKEERVNRIKSTLSEATDAADIAIHQKPAGVTGSASEQGQGARGDWKMFALIKEKSDPVQLSLKCDPQLSEILREKYETVMPGYHLNKKHWNTILLTGQLDWEEIKDLIRHSYDLVKKTS